MADKNIKIQVIDKKAIVTGAPVIVCGNSDYTATFAFDDEWSLTGPRTARFVYVRDGVVKHEDVVFSGNDVAVPVLENVGFVDVGVFAGNLCTTTPARVPCRKSILCGSGALHDPSPDIYDQIMRLFEDMAEAGAFGATEAQAQQIEKNKQDIEQLGATKADQTDLDNLDSRVNLNTQSISQLGDAKASQADLATLEARMNTFTKLNEGSNTTGDAELFDGRVGHDGTEYDNLGEAIRSQVSALHTKADEKLGYIRYIDAAMDFDLLVDVGVYNVVNDIVKDCEHYPSEFGGVITVKKRTGYVYPITQELLDNKNNLYTRYKTSTAWTEWKKYASKDDVEEMSLNCYSFKGYINAYTDINTLVDVGVYQVMDGVASGCLNYPSKYPGIISIKSNTSRTVLVQQLVDAKGNLFIRYKTLTEWGPWNKYSIEYEIESHTDGVGALVEVAETYFNVAYDPDDRMVYESTYGLFNKFCRAVYVKNTNELALDDEGEPIDASTLDMSDEEVKKKYDVFKAIVCSQFEQACIAGITYANSRYEGGENSALPWGFVSDGSGVYFYTDWDANNDYMTACEQAKYFDNKGLLHTFDVNRNRLKPGDLLFYDTLDDPTITEPAYYKKITHVAICLGADKNRYTIMHSTDEYLRLADRVLDPETGEVKGGVEAGVLATTYRYSVKAPSYFVRSPIMAEYSTKKIASTSLNKNANYTAKSAYIGGFTFDEPLQRGFYTVQFDDLGDSLGYIVVTYQDGQEVNYTAVKNANIHRIIFYAEMPVSKIYMRVSDGTRYACTWAKLYKGYHS